MPSRDRGRAKGRREAGAFHALPAAVLDAPNFVALSPAACKLTFDLLRQLRLKKGGPVNNGDLSIAWTLMQPIGWASKETLCKARDELEHYGIVVRTRQGGRHRASLYGFSWWSINECGGKLDPPYNVERPVPPGTWKDPRPPFAPVKKTETVPRLAGQCAPPGGSIGVRQ
jgi:hypothetical protein